MGAERLCVCVCVCDRQSAEKERADEPSIDSCPCSANIARRLAPLRRDEEA
jgi:hypothetical protein